MANAAVAVMGPPPSPKEPRRSGRRSVPSGSTSKSPAGSPTSDSAPKAKDTSHRPSSSSNSSSSKNRRHKHDDHDEPLDDVRKGGTNGNGNGSSRSKRKGKEKEKSSNGAGGAGDDGDEGLPQVDGSVAGDFEDNNEEEGGITRCICGEYYAPSERISQSQPQNTVDDDEEQKDRGDWMAQCEMCTTWQHGQCMGYAAEKDMPEHYYCEECRPDLHVELLKKHAKRARQSSINSHHARHASRSSRSRSPILQPKPTKRRNTMNSRDAAYDESVHLLLEVTAAEAAAATQDVKTSSPISATANGEANGDGDGEPEADIQPNSKRKRKRSEDDAAPAKRTRSASIASDRTNVALGRDATPINTANGNLKATPAPTPTAKASNSRNRRATARKTQVQDLGAAEGEEAGGTAPARRPANNRSKANTVNDNNGRRTQGSATGGHGVNSSGHANAAAASRAYHQSHAYAVSQQPLFTSWNLPDYLAHLEAMLPTDVPRPLEVRGSGVDYTGHESLERTTERGVKVKWPAKRMSVGDMNKRVRALVEWVGREQASALERTRRREALENAFKEGLSNQVDSEDVTMVDEGPATIESPLQERRPNGVDSVPSMAPKSGPSDSGKTTMKMMEELMEELISFQERFGPGAKAKERERRVAAS